MLKTLVFVVITNFRKMSEGAVTKKRVRKPKVVAEPEPLIINNRFVCAYTGISVGKALLFKTLPGLAFANIPCAFSYARAHSAGEKKLRAMAEEYNQSFESIPYAPDVKDLQSQGGKLTYETWIGECGIWDAHAVEAGSSVEQYRAAHPPPQKVAKKKKVADHVELDAGCYLIGAKGQISKCNAEERKADDEGVPVKGHKTVASAWRTVCKSGKGEEGHTRLEHFVVNDCLFVGTTVSGPDDVRNDVASNMSAINFTGSVLVITGRKIKVAK